MTPDLEPIVAKYVALRDKAKQIKQDYETAVRPYNEAMEKLSNVLSVYMGSAQSVRTEVGTAYRTETVSVKVEDRESWFAFVQENQLWDALTTHVEKEPIKKWMDEHGGTGPPGVALTYIKSVNVRRS
jgi:RNAse (barnase) inhibitor barstar